MRKQVEKEKKQNLSLVKVSQLMQCQKITCHQIHRFRADSHFDLTTRDKMVLMAIVNGGKAKRNTMIPLLAKYLSAMGEDESMYDVFLKTQEDIERIGEGQILELRSTM